MTKSEALRHAWAANPAAKLSTIQEAAKLLCGEDVSESLANQIKRQQNLTNAGNRGRPPAIRGNVPLSHVQLRRDEFVTLLRAAMSDSVDWKVVTSRFASSVAAAHSDKLISAMRRDKQ